MFAKASDTSSRTSFQPAIMLSGAIEKDLKFLSIRPGNNILHIGSKFLERFEPYAMQSFFYRFDANSGKHQHQN